MDSTPGLIVMVAFVRFDYFVKISQGEKITNFLPVEEWNEIIRSRSMVEDLPKMARQEQFPIEKPTGFYAFVDVAERMSDSGSRTRLNIHLDCIRAADFDNHRLKRPIEDEAPYFLIRIMTTEGKLIEMSGIDRAPSEGDWLFIELDPFVKSFPRAWTMALNNNIYMAPLPARLTTIRYLPGNDDGPEPQSLGAAAVKSKSRKIKKIFDLNNFSMASEKSIKAQLNIISVDSKITVHDVGQASFCSLRPRKNPDDIQALKANIYFDVGWPMWLNLRTLPRNPKYPTIETNSLIVLSHWDWDHFELGRRLQSKQQMKWIAPAQIVGPNAFKFAHSLLVKRKLMLIGNFKNPINSKYLCLLKCGGPQTDRNRSGLALLYKFKKDRILLTGDADYSCIQIPGGLPLSGVVVPHHGAMPDTIPPTPAIPRVSKAIVSYGKGNVYKHPRGAPLNHHKKLLWDLHRTATHNRVRRGDRDF